MKPKIEYRVVAAQQLEDGPGFDGYAATWMTVDTYGTAWKRGAFKKSIEERGSKIPVLWSHMPDKPIGRLTALEEDSKGLRFTASIVEATQAGAETMALLRADVPLGMSFGFRTIKQRLPKENEWERLTYADDTDWFQSDEGRGHVRIMEETALWEVSPVTFPANTMTLFTDVRAAVEADTLATITEAIKTGTLDERSAVLIDELVAAWGERAGPDEETIPPTPDRARREKDIAISLAQIHAQWGHLLGEKTNVYAG
jgi:HK97 family phage prohead protease